jgi:hypothetical protein
MGETAVMRTATAVQLSGPTGPERVPFRVAAGMEEDENPTASGIELLKSVSVDVSAADLKLAEQLSEYLNALAEEELELADEEGVEIGKRQSRRSVLKDALHAGLTRRIKLITQEVGGDPLPDAKDSKAMKAYAKRVLTKANKRS